MPGPRAATTKPRDIEMTLVTNVLIVITACRRWNGTPYFPEPDPKCTHGHTNTMILNCQAKKASKKSQESGVSPEFWSTRRQPICIQRVAVCQKWNRTIPLDWPGNLIDALISGAVLHLGRRTE